MGLDTGSIHLRDRSNGLGHTNTILHFVSAERSCICISDPHAKNNLPFRRSKVDVFYFFKEDTDSDAMVFSVWSLGIKDHLHIARFKNAAAFCNACKARQGKTEGY